MLHPVERVTAQHSHNATRSPGYSRISCSYLSSFFGGVHPSVLFEGLSPSECSLHANQAPQNLLTGVAYAHGARIHFAAIRSLNKAGALGPVEVGEVLSLFKCAKESGEPLLVIGSSAGADIGQGRSSLDAWGELLGAFSQDNRPYPIIFVPTGSCAGGMAYLAAFADLVVMPKGSHLFLTGPKIVEQVRGRRAGKEELGGAEVHLDHSGIADIVTADISSAFKEVRRLLKVLLPIQKHPIVLETLPVGDTACLEVYLHSRKEHRAADIRPLLTSLFSKLSVESDYLELHPSFGPSIVTSVAYIGNRPLGIIATQPLAGAFLDDRASRKVAEFVEFCVRGGLPLVLFLDSAAFLPGVEQERAGILWFGSRVLKAIKQADDHVPLVVFHLGKSFGGGYVALASRGLAPQAVHYSLCGPDPARVIGSSFGHDARTSLPKPALFSDKQNVVYEISPQFLPATLYAHLMEFYEHR